MIYTFRWSYSNGNTTFGFNSSQFSSIYVIESFSESDVQEYICNADNEFASGVAVIYITLGGKLCQKR